MPAVNFYLKKAEEKSGRSLIYLQFKYQGKRLVYAFGQNIDLDNWNKKKQRVKSNLETTADGKHSLNDLLDNLEKECLKAYNKALPQGIPATQTLKDALNKFIDQNEDKPADQRFWGLLERFINNEIKHKGRDKCPNTIKTYRTLKGHLQEYEKKNKPRIDFDSITLDFYYKYVSFLKSLKLSPNAISKDIQILKVIMGEAVDLSLTNNLQFRHKKFAVNREDTDAVFLTEKEIINLYRYDLSKKPKLERVKDLFVFGCFVGLRFSDYSTIKPENIVKRDGELYITTITKKTKEQVIIPCDPIVLEIFKKYEKNPNKLPPAPSNQKFNDYIKDACKEAKLTETGRLSSDLHKELWQCISSHTARRSFATNLYLQGFPTIDLMKITGHKTEKAFMKYIKTTKLDSAKRLSAHIKKNWSAKLLKVAG